MKKITFTNGETIDGAYTFNAMQDNIEEAIKPYVLWQNNNHTAQFDAQSITLTDAIENYTHYEIVYKYVRTGREMFSTGRIPTGFLTFLNLALFSMVIRKVTALSGTSLTFEDAKYASTYGIDPANVSNGYLIPYQIIGYKNN